MRAGALVRSLLALCALAALGCQDDGQEFPLLIEARAREAGNEMVAGLRVRDAQGNLLARTDSAGRALLPLRGREGDAVVLWLQPPAGMRIEGGEERLRVLLRRSGPLGGEGPGLLSQSVRLQRERVAYVLFIQTAFSGVPVTVNGVGRGQTGGSGISMILHEGLPGEAVALRLLTQEDPRIIPRDPDHTLVLPEEPALLLWRQELIRRLPPAKPRPRRKVPTAI